MLDDVERRRFLVQPAREDPLPLLVRLLHVELNERTGELLFLPWRRRLAGAQANDRVFPAHRLTRMQRNALDNPVPLVEDPENGDTLRHRRHAALAIRHSRDLPCGRQWNALLLVPLATRGKGQRGQRNACEAHVYSGIQGS
jgi:hypothetical protein